MLFENFHVVLSLVLVHYHGHYQVFHQHHHEKIKRTQSMDIPRAEAPIGQSAASATRPSHGPMIKFDNREEFTNHDVEELNTQLDANLLPKDSGTRLSRALTQSSKQSSRISNASERSNLSNVSDKPWKP